MEISVVRTRAQATRDVQVEIAAQWVWPDKTLAQWDTDLTLLTEKERNENAAEQEEHAIRAQRNAAYKSLERFTNCTDDFDFPVNLTGARKVILGLS